MTLWGAVAPRKSCCHSVRAASGVDMFVVDCYFASQWRSDWRFRLATEALEDPLPRAGVIIAWFHLWVGRRCHPGDKERTTDDDLTVSQKYNNPSRSHCHYSTTGFI